MNIANTPIRRMHYHYKVIPTLLIIWFMAKCNSFTLQSRSHRRLPMHHFQRNDEFKNYHRISLYKDNQEERDLPDGPALSTKDKEIHNVNKDSDQNYVPSSTSADATTITSQSNAMVDDDTLSTNRQPSIDNEVELKDFVKLINVQDKNLPITEEPTLDFFRLVEILWNKSLDTVEDAILIFKRKMNESKFVPLGVLDEWNDDQLTHKPRLLVIGSGWASHAFIKVIDTDKFRVLNVSPTNYFVFTPMLASSSVGTTEVRSIVESVRDSNPLVSFLEGSAVKIDVEKQIVKVKLGEGGEIETDALVGYGDDKDDEDDDDKVGQMIQIDYDILVYAAGVGPISSSNRVPGLSSKNVHFLKSVHDAKRLRSTVIGLLEKASQPNISEEERRRLLTFVVVGAGPTGVEYTGELSDFLSDVTGFGKGKGIKRTIAPFANLSKYTRVILVQGASEVLPQFDVELRRSAQKTLDEQGVDVLTNTRVTKIDSNERLTISAVDQEGEKVDQDLDCGLIVWAGGTKPVALTEQLISNLDKYYEKAHRRVAAASQVSVNGRIPVDKWLRAIGSPGNVLAMGDAAATVGHNTVILPQTAQVAAQQGAYVARLLNKGYNLSGESNDGSVGECENSIFLAPPCNDAAMNGDFNTKLRLRGAVKAKPFEFLNLGQLAYLGGGQALSQVELGDRQIFNQAGSVGFLLWRSVYIVKQVSTKTRLLVLFDWFQTKIFGRDVTRM